MRLVLMLRFTAFAVTLFIPMLSHATGFTILSSERSVEASIRVATNSPGGPCCEVDDDEQSFQLGTFEKTVNPVTTSPDQQFSDSSFATQSSFIDENTINAFLDVDAPRHLQFFDGSATSMLSITFQLDEELEFNFSGSYEEWGDDGNSAFTVLENLSGGSFEIRGGTWTQEEEHTCPPGTTYAPNVCGFKSELRLHNAEGGVSFWSVRGVLPAGTYILSSSTENVEQDGTSSSVTLAFSVPEPTTALLVGLGLVGLALAGTRRDSANE